MTSVKQAPAVNSTSSKVETKDNFNESNGSSGSEQVPNPKLKITVKKQPNRIEVRIGQPWWQRLGNWWKDFTKGWTFVPYQTFNV